MNRAPTLVRPAANFVSQQFTMPAVPHRIPPSLPTCGRYSLIHFQSQVCKRLRPAEIPIRGRVSAPFPFQAKAQASFVEHSVTSFDEPAGIIPAEEASWFDCLFREISQHVARLEKVARPRVASERLIEEDGFHVQGLLDRMQPPASWRGSVVVTDDDDTRRGASTVLGGDRN